MKIPRLLKQSFTRASAMIVVKLIGLIGRVILTRLVGAEGIGMYQIAYSFYGFLIMLSGGLPTALAIITAKKTVVGWQFLKIISLFLVLFGSCISLIVFWNSTLLAELLGNPRLNYALRGLAPAILSAPLLGLLRGYLQGQEQFGLIAASEVIEQACRISCMLLIVYHLMPFGIDRAVGGGIYATFIGSLISFVILTIYVSMDKKKLLRSPYKSSTLPFVWFFRTSFIISITRMLIPASEFIDAILIPNRLISAGYSTSEATSIYGIIIGMATIIVYTPTLVTGALSHTTTMRIASHWQQGNFDNFHRLSRLSLKIGWLWGLFSSTFLFVYATELSLFIFNTEDAYLTIKYLSAIPLVVGFREISTSILWSKDAREIPFIGLIVGISCSITLQYFLIGIPGLGYIGAAVGILSMEIISVIWNLKALNISKYELKQVFSYIFLDTAAIFFIMFLSYFFIHSFQEDLIDITRFILSGCLYFMISGLYMYIRLVADLKINKN
ncbi:stage V sporulation protein B [Paenibacillus sp. DS2015]|uniref:oligosaccharide flippase family protein n=1 Tax=Paenibacillus sp. DS2015 TaxID=3373917 RepID=UPI003D199EEC